MADIIQIRRGSAAYWTAVNPVLAQGEDGYELDTMKEKRGDGVTAWNDLPYKSSGGAVSVEQIVDVTNKSQIVNIDLDATKVYRLLVDLSLTATERIRANNLRLLYGLGHDIVTISTTEPNSLIFEGDNTADIRISDLSISAGGTGSRAFDVEDGTGDHEVRLKGVNFNGTSIIGDFRGYRQGFWTDLGFYGCNDGATFHGEWSGFKLFSSNLFGFGATGTLLKQGTALTFNNRFYIDLNASLVTGSKLLNFNEAVFLSNELLQINACQIIYNGVVDTTGNSASALIPNISANSPKCLWSNNIGLPNTAEERYIENTAAATYVVDWLNSVFNIEMTGDTVFTEKNLPANLLKSKEIKIYLTGEFVPTFPSAWLLNLTGTYKGDEINEISLRYLKNGVYYMKISNSLTEYPAPALKSVLPVSVIPSSTSEITLKGSFFTPATIVSIEGQTVNSVEFIDSGELKLSVTSGSVESEFDITISNGTSVLFADRFIVNLGVVTVLNETDVINISGSIDFTEIGKAKQLTAGVTGTGDWDIVIPSTTDFSLRYNRNFSPINPDATGFGNLSDAIYFLSTTDNSEVIVEGSYSNGIGANGSGQRLKVRGTDIIWAGTGAFPPNGFDYEFRRVGDVFNLRRNGTIIHTFPVQTWEDFYVRLKVRAYNFNNVKYIELP